MNSLLVFESFRPVVLPSYGTIDGKFDSGYLVSVKLGSDILNGVPYHPDHGGPSSSSALKTCTAIVHCTQQPHHSYRKKRKRMGEPRPPKHSCSGYNFFFAEKHSRLKSLYTNRGRGFTKMIGESCNRLTPEERMVYQNYGLQDRKRYEMKEYKERENIMISIKESDRLSGAKN